MTKLGGFVEHPAVDRQDHRVPELEIPEDERAAIGRLRSQQHGRGRHMRLAPIEHPGADLRESEPFPGRRPRQVGRQCVCDFGVERTVRFRLPGKVREQRFHRESELAVMAGGTAHLEQRGDRLVVAAGCERDHREIDRNLDAFAGSRAFQRLPQGRDGVGRANLALQTTQTMGQVDPSIGGRRLLERPSEVPGSAGHGTGPFGAIGGGFEERNVRRASGRLARENMGRDLLHVGGACEEHVRGAGMAGSCPEASAARTR